MKYLIFIVLCLQSYTSYSSNKDSLNTDKVDPVSLCFEEYKISLDTVCNRELFDLVYQWMEVDYKFAGNTMSGVDCSGFVTAMYQQWRNIQLQGGSRDIFKKVTQVKKHQLKEGDLLFFKIYKGRISHVGIYLGNNKFAHSTTHAGVIISDLDEAYYKKYYFTAGEIQ